MALFNRNTTPPGAASADAEAPREGLAPAASFEDERGIPPVGRRSYQSRGQLMALGAAILALVGLMWMINRPTNTVAPSPDDPRASKEQRFDEPTSSADIAPATPKAPTLVTPFEPPKPPGDPIHIVPKIDPRQSGPTAATAQTTGPRALTPLEKRMRSKTVIDANSRGSTQPTSAQPQAGGATPQIPGLPGLNTDGSVSPAMLTTPATSITDNYYGMTQRPPTGTGGAVRTSSQDDGERSNNTSSEGSLSDILRPTRLDGASATRIRDRTLMLAAGKLIDCSLDTAISTVVAGMVKCSLTRNIYGENGNAVVMERGTELIGDYRSNLRTAQSRLGIVWTRAKTPGGVVIELVSPASDPLGRAGVDGYVDNHFWQRYGAAMLLSSLDDALSLIVQQRNRNSGGAPIYLPPSSTGTAKDAAAVALENNIKIPPTIVKHQGEHITVFVARDLDFRSVYGYRSPSASIN